MDRRTVDEECFCDRWPQVAIIVQQTSSESYFPRAHSRRKAENKAEITRLSYLDLIFKQQNAGKTEKEKSERQM